MSPPATTSKPFEAFNNKIYLPRPASPGNHMSDCVGDLYVVTMMDCVFLWCVVLTHFNEDSSFMIAEVLSLFANVLDLEAR